MHEAKRLLDHILTLSTRRLLMASACILHAACYSAIVGCSKPTTVDVQPAVEHSSSNRDYWDAVFVGGSHVGFSHLKVVEEVDRDNRKMMSIQLDTKITLNRFGSETEQAMSIVGTESSDGRIDSLTTEMVSGGGKVRCEITNTGKELLVKSNTAGVESRNELSADCLGILGFEPDLRRQPLRPGETRSYRQFIPFMNAVAKTTLEAKSLERTSHLGEDRELLRIENTMTMAGGNTMAVTIWADDRGEVLKTDMNGLQTTYRTTMEKAIPAETATGFDLGLQSLVKLEHPIENAHSTHSIKYRVRMKNGDPAQFIRRTDLQELDSIDENTVEVTVRSGRPTQDGSVASDSQRPAAEFLAPNSLIQSDAEEVVALADRVPDGDTIWQTAGNLEAFVHALIAEKDFATAFASAKETAQSKQGDCTEHSVLLTALCRAKNIPSRCAMGLVYFAPKQALAFHMWSEVWIDGRWIPLDATLAMHGTGAAHIKVSDTSLADGSGLESMLPVLQMIGNLEVDVIAKE